MLNRNLFVCRVTSRSVSGAATYSSARPRPIYVGTGSAREAKTRPPLAAKCGLFCACLLSIYTCIHLPACVCACLRLSATVCSLLVRVYTCLLCPPPSILVYTCVLFAPNRLFVNFYIMLIFSSFLCFSTFANICHKIS